MRYLERRLNNILGDSSLDDAVTKTFMRLIEIKLEVLMKERDPLEIAHAQGFVAALREGIEEVRRHNKQKIVNEEEDT
jgi:hypothetical protein